MLGSERKLKRPDEHMPPRLRRKLPSLKFSAETGSERYTYSTAARVICTAEAAVMELRMLCCQRCYVRCVLRQQLREKNLCQHVQSSSARTAV